MLYYLSSRLLIIGLDWYFYSGLDDWGREGFCVVGFCDGWEGWVGGFMLLWMFVVWFYFPLCLFAWEFLGWLVYDWMSDAIELV